MSNSGKTAFDKVKKARSNSRPTGKDYIDKIFTNFIEMHGDRNFGDDPAIVGGIGFLGNIPVTVIAGEKGHDAKERVFRNFGAPNPEGYRKALRLMKQAEKFGRPVICFVDTSGAFCGIGAEERGQGHAIATNLMEMMSLKVPVISVVIGEGGSGGALAMAVANQVWMLENSIYSVISPEGCASILWKDSGKSDEAAECLKLTAADAFNFNIIDKIISEEGLGKNSFYKALKSDLIDAIKELSELSQDQITGNRYYKFRSMGNGFEEKE